ncbi:hypothetical protein MBRA1_003794 [Malassezia brasiliensis]|uniref:Elongin-A n=1 Tax=Malassezia brasiliensis TaxID=1821822 RepID=A0AAF0IUN2_9BASI|nr:hypothetical protein MBRA1_003794 [Malassezia brasiliensis]
MTASLPQLSALCRRAVHDLGDMPYRLARPILQQCRPEQLRELEAASPHLADDTEELWQHACLRDFSDLRKLHEDGALPPPASWRALYNDKQQQIEAAKAAATAKIKGRYAEHSAQKDAKKMVVSDVNLRPARARAKAPKAPVTAGQAMMARARNGSAMQVRRMMLIPPRSGARTATSPARGFVRAAPAPRPRAAEAGMPRAAMPAAGPPPTGRPPTGARTSPPPPASSTPSASSPARVQKRPAPEPASSIFMPKRRIPSQARHGHVERS